MNGWMEALDWEKQGKKPEPVKLRINVDII